VIEEASQNCKCVVHKYHQFIDITSHSGELATFS
jgi:hypothetical protein